VLNLIDHRQERIPVRRLFPLIALHAYHSGRSRCGSPPRLPSSSLVDVLMYQHLFMILAFWIAECAGLPCIERREMALFVASPVAIVLHLLQSVLVLGWSTFSRNHDDAVEPHVRNAWAKPLSPSSCSCSSCLDKSRSTDAMEDGCGENCTSRAEVCVLVVGAAILVGMATELRTARLHDYASAVFVRWLRLWVARSCGCGNGAGALPDVSGVRHGVLPWRASEFLVAILVRWV